MPTTITLTTEYMKRNRAMAVPGAYWDRDSRSYVLDVDTVTPRTALIALKLFPELAVTHPELAELRDNYAQDVRPLDYAQRWWDSQTHSPGGQVLAPRVEARMAQEGMAFYDFQRIDLSYLAQRLRQDGAAYLGWERGLGKTLGAIALAEAIGAQRILVLSGNTAKRSVWLPDWERWAGDWGIPYAAIPNDNTERVKHGQKIPGSGPRDQFLTALQADKDAPRVVFAHMEALNIVAKTRKNNRGWDRLGEWDLIILDEGHHISNKKALQTKALKRIPTRHKLLLSGSIISNHAGELYSQLNWLFPKHYKNELRDWNDRFLDWVDLEGHREYVGVRLERLHELRDELGRYMVYRTKGDELDLPPITIQDLPIDLSPRQRRIYDDLARDAIAELDSGQVLTAANGLSLLTKLRQVATGLDLVGDQLADSAKIDAAVDIIRDAPDEAFVVFTYFVGTAEALARRLADVGIQAFTVTGKVTDHEQRAGWISRFQAGEGRVFIGTLGTLGESVTLSRASNVLFLDRSWNPQLNDQSTDRVAGGFRAQQVGRPITVTNLVARDTVDESRITPVLHSKEAVRAVVLGRRAADGVQPAATGSSAAAPRLHAGQLTETEMAINDAIATFLS